jgi:hypothetical protein
MPQAPSDDELRQRADSDIYRLGFAISDLWGNFKPLASRAVLMDHLAELSRQSKKLEKLVETLIKYSQTKS